RRRHRRHDPQAGDGHGRRPRRGRGRGHPGRAAPARHAGRAVHGARRRHPGEGPVTGKAASAPALAPLGSTSTEIGADLRHVRSWVFDLDNTLYPPETQFLRQVEQRINQYVVRTSGLASAEALAVQKTFLHDYGTSLAGLMMHYEIDPHHFLEEVHDVR